MHPGSAAVAVAALAVWLHLGGEPAADAARPRAGRPSASDEPSLYARRLELFKELLPSLRRVLVLADPIDPAGPDVVRAVRAVAARLRLHLEERQVTSQVDIEGMFATLAPGEVEAVYIASPRLAANFSLLLTGLATERRLPIASHDPRWAEHGALFSYGGSPPELVINLATARSLGLLVPQSLRRRATTLIDRAGRP